MADAAMSVIKGTTRDVDVLFIKVVRSVIAACPSIIHFIHIHYLCVVFSPS